MDSLEVLCIVVLWLAFFWSLGEWADSAHSPRGQKNEILICVAFYFLFFFTINQDLFSQFDDFKLWPSRDNLTSVLLNNRKALGLQLAYEYIISLLCKPSVNCDLYDLLKKYSSIQCILKVALQHCHLIF